MPGRQVLGSIGGIALAAVVLAALPTLTQEYERRRQFFDFDGVWLISLLIVILGIVVGTAIALARRDPMLVAVPAALMGLAYLVAGPVGVRVGDILPAPISRRIASSFGPASVIMIGVLTAAAVWGRWTGSDSVASERWGHRRQPQLLGIALGSVSALGFLALLGPLTVELLSQSRFGGVGASRWATLGLFALGAATGALIMVGPRIPALSLTIIGVMVAVFVVWSPMAEPPGWWLDLWSRLRRFHTAVISPAVPLTVGILIGSVTWRRSFERPSGGKDSFTRRNPPPDAVNRTGGTPPPEPARR
jgi:hypothetical protein